MFLYIAAGVFVAAVVILVIYIMVTWKATRETQNDIKKTMDEIKNQLDGVSTEATALLQKTNQLAEDVNEKSAKLDVLFDGVKGVGSSVQSFNDTLKNFSTKMKTTASTETEDASQVVKWGTVLMDLWQRKKE